MKEARPSRSVFSPKIDQDAGSGHPEFPKNDIDPRSIGGKEMKQDTIQYESTSELNPYGSRNPEEDHRLYEFRSL
ncbi:MAG: hypothetical protein QXK24_08735 [Ignisphaera sp.]